MRVIIALSLFFLSLFGDDFINKFEYGEMLYKNPRGVSCEGCHGVFGEGQNMGNVVKNKKEIKIIAPDIRKATIDEIKKSMSVRRSIMPSYFLTDSELDAIVYYLHRLNEQKRLDVNGSN
jgi:mono/diheme cytochrome c family protein